MSGGATFNPKLLVDGKRPFDRYPSAHEVFSRTVSLTAKKVTVTTAFAVLFWPIYKALARRWRRSGLGEAGFFTAGLVATLHATYILTHGFFALIERNCWLEQCKLDRHPHQLGSWRLVISTLKGELTSKLVTSPILAYTVLFPLMKRRGMPAFDAARPSLSQLFRHFLLSDFVNEVAFYWAHRFFHSSFIYAKVHKKHHEWKGTVSYSAEHAHPAEQLLANFLPSMGGCILVGAHPWTFFVWIAKRLTDTYEVHSGYAFDIPVLTRLGLANWRGAANHDFHHTGNSGNFGNGTLWLDWLFGTMDSYAMIGGDEGYVKSKTDEKISYMRSAESPARQLLAAP